MISVQAPVALHTVLPPTAVAEARPADVPENAPEHCPGVESDQAGKSSACAGCPNQSVCASTPKGPDPDLPAIRGRMADVRKKILVMSGKGGVGKSTFTAQLGWAFASDEDRQTGVMDIDICGPSIPTIMGLQNATIHSTSSGWSPVYLSDNLSCMSIGFMLPPSSTVPGATATTNPSAIIWRGPKKNGLIKQFLKDVEWGQLDYLLVDTPPGTSDEHLSIANYLRDGSDGGVDGAILITTPQEVSLQDVRREISFCKKMGIPILGLVENMSGFVCPSCSGKSDVFYPTTGGAQALADELGLRMLGKVPLDPRIGKACDMGESFLDEYPDSPATSAYLEIIDKIKDILGEK